MEAAIIPVSYTLKQVKTIDDLRTALNGQSLIMYSKLEPFHALDARKKHAFSWPKLYAIKFNEQGQMVYYSTLTVEFNYWSDICRPIDDHFTRYKSTTWSGDEYTKGQEQMFALFLYNRKRANTMYIVPSFLPANLKEDLGLYRKTASKIVGDALDHCFRTAVKKLSHGDTLDKQGRYKRIKDTVVAIRTGYPTSFIKFTLKKQKYSFQFDFNDQYKLTTEPDRNGASIRSACTYSNTLGRSNTDYKILYMKQKDVRQLHTMLETAAKIHGKVRTHFHTWLKTAPQPTLK